MNQSALAADPALTRRSRSVVAAYTWVIGAITLTLALAVAKLGPPSDFASALIMLGAVALVGLPHGAYDLEVARRLFAPRLGRWWWVSFGASYLALAVLGIGLWATVPAIGLTALLIGGAAHWGLDDLDSAPRHPASTAWLAISRGAIPVAAPMAFHPHAVATIFTSILGSPATPGVVQACGVAWLFASMPGVAASVWSTEHRSNAGKLRTIGEPAVLLLWFAVAPPVLAFTVYFCFWHSVRHSLRSACSVEPSNGVCRAMLIYVRAAALPTILTWLLAGVAAALFLRSDPFTEVAWSVIFIGLFALTIPHVVLEYLEHRMG